MQNAFADLEIAAQLDADEPQLHVHCAEVFIRKLEFEKAEEHARKALEKDARKASAKLLLGLAQWAQRETLDSIDTLRSAVTYADIDDIKEAVKILERLIKELGEITGYDILMNILQNAIQASDKK